MYHAATITAYQAKDDTFSIAMRDNETKKITRATGFPDLSTARYEVQKRITALKKKLQQKCEL